MTRPVCNSGRVWLWAITIAAAAGVRAEDASRNHPGDAFPPELVDFVPHERNPVFISRGTGHWDARIRERGWILREGGLYRMWYTGYQPRGVMKLGYATSPDGLQWTRYESNPIYDDHWIEDMMVVKHGDTYYMFAEGLRDRAQLLSSPDGIRWTRHGKLDIRQPDGRPIPDVAFGTPTAWFSEGTWYLLYERNGDEAIWLATSPDLKIWTNVQDDPVMRPGPGYYDKKYVAVNQMIEYQGRYYIYYHGLGETNGNWTTSIATSTDLIRWAKYPQNPLVPVESNKSSGILIHDGERFRLYTMHDQVRVHFPRPR